MQGLAAEDVTDNRLLSQARACFLETNLLPTSPSLPKDLRIRAKFFAGSSSSGTTAANFAERGRLEPNGLRFAECLAGSSDR
jgi:hypothetical protein